MKLVQFTGVSHAASVPFAALASRVDHAWDWSAEILCKDGSDAVAYCLDASSSGVMPVTGIVVLTESVCAVKAAIDCDDVVLDLLFDALTMFSQGPSHCPSPGTYEAMGHDGIEHKMAYSFGKSRGILRSAIRAIANSQKVNLFVAESSTDRIIILYDFSGSKVVENLCRRAEICP